MIRPTIALAALLSLACAGAAASQKPEPANPAAQQQAPSAPAGAIDESKLVISYFTPRNIRVKLAGELATELFGESIFVSSATMPPREMSHFLTMSDMLIVRDTPEQAKRILATLQELDGKAATAASAAKASPTTAIYGPRHVRADALMRALHPLESGVQVSLLGQEERMLLTGPAERIQEVSELLARLDQPRPQVVITAYLVRGSGAGEAAPNTVGLQEELVANLRKLLPIKSFDLVATSVVRASVAGDSIGVSATPSPALTYTLSMQPAAYDPQSGQLTLSKLTFQITEGMNAAGEPPPRRQSLETSLSVRAGEYAVLGAVGGDPIFLVLRVQPVG